MHLTESQHDHLETTRGHAANCAGLDEWVTDHSAGGGKPITYDRESPSIEAALDQLAVCKWAFEGSGLLR